MGLDRPQSAIWLGSQGRPRGVLGATETS